MADIRRIREDALKEWDKKKQEDEREQDKRHLALVENLLTITYPNQIKSTGEVRYFQVSTAVADPAFDQVFTRHCKKQGYNVSASRGNNVVVYHFKEDPFFVEKKPEENSAAGDAGELLDEKPKEDSSTGDIHAVDPGYSAAHVS